jgi:hypothetical protein
MLNCVHRIIVNDRKNIILAIVHPMSWNVKKKIQFFFCHEYKLTKVFPKILPAKSDRFRHS